MNILILGGTRFIGRHIAERLLVAGHRVTVLTRGRSGDDLPPEIERLRGDRDEGVAGLAALSGRAWDVCIDTCGYMPSQVRPSTALLRSSVRRYVIVSAVRVYGDPTIRPVGETHPLVPPASPEVTEITDETYGPLKVACEGIVQHAFPGRFTLLRPQVVVGPQDPSTRYSFWIQRAMRNSAMLAPGDGSDHLQCIDVRDVARFIQLIIEHNNDGIYNLAGPRISWAEFVRLLGVKHPVWVPAPLIKEAGLTFSELPLYRPERISIPALGSSSLMDISNERAVSAGLTITDPATTLQDTRVWLAGRAFTPALSPEREAELIRLALNRSAQQSSG